MINFFKLFKKENTFTGVIGDGAYDHIVRFDEAVAGASKAQFASKTLATMKKYPYQYQDGSSACVAFTVSKITTILYHNLSGLVTKFSPAFYYTRRFNKPAEGMAFANAVTLATEGALPYDLLPCEGMNEKEINNLTVKNYHLASADSFSLPIQWVELPIDFDTVASTIEKTGKGVMLWFQFSSGEFFGIDKPVVLNNKNTWRHSVTAIDAFSFGGDKYILIEDSADKEIYYRKWITEKFFKDKCVLARYPLNFKFVLGDTKPTYTGSTASLQDCMRWLGYFPTNVKSTGYYGKITRDAISIFQRENQLKVTGLLNEETNRKLVTMFS